MLIVTVAVSAVPGAVEAAKAGVANESFGKAVVLAMVALLPLAAYFGARLMPVTPLAAGEEGGPFRLIARSWALTRGSVLRLIGLLLLVTVAYGTLLIAIQSVVGLAVLALIGPADPGSPGAFVITLVGAGVTTLASPYLATLIARVYAQLAA
jgi:hypothetical protein